MIQHETREDKRFERDSVLIHDWHFVLHRLIVLAVGEKVNFESGKIFVKFQHHRKDENLEN